MADGVSQWRYDPLHILHLLNSGFVTQPYGRMTPLEQLFWQH